MGNVVHFFYLSYFLHTAPLIYAETSLVLHLGKKINKVNDKHRTTSSSDGDQAQDSLQIVYVPRRLGSNLEQNQNGFLKGRS